MPYLRFASLAGNKFSGPIPLEWCEGKRRRIDIYDNAALCDEVPPCMQGRITSYRGTALLDPLKTSIGGEVTGGQCGIAPPICGDECGFVGPDPPYWTNATTIAFSFTQFSNIDDEGGVIKYDWQLGTIAGIGNLISWTPYQGFTAPGKPASGNSISIDRYYVDHIIPTFSLKMGAQYYLSLRGWNAGGASMGTVITSSPITVDPTPPRLPDGGAVYCGEYHSCSPISADSTALGVSWDLFKDAESAVESYSYQVFEYHGDRSSSSNGTDDVGIRRPGKKLNYVGQAITGKIKVDQTQMEEQSALIPELELEEGKSYFVRVYALNAAGLEGHADAPPVTIVNTNSPLVFVNAQGDVAGNLVGVFAAILILFTTLISSFVTWWWVQRKHAKKLEAKKRRKSQVRSFEHLMQGLSSKISTDSDRLDDLKNLKELAFVITDLANSTKIAESCPRGSEKVQDTHDTLLRELIVRHGGYEINTEGDAFHIAFKDISAASKFCLDVQYQMMDQEWPREVLKLSCCQEVKNKVGQVIFRGPRLRMGLHWAQEGTVAQRLHAITRHRVYTGPAFQVTRELCEAAAGGQVLLSQEAWARLSRDMAAACHPVVEQLGYFQLESWSAPMWVYQLSGALGQPIERKFEKEVSSLELVSRGVGLAVIPPPQSLTNKGHLAFVACRLVHPGGEVGASTTTTVPQPLSSTLYNLLASVAQQYGGCLFRTNHHRGCYLLAFADSVDGIRFCHAAQALLMYQESWPGGDASSEWMGAMEKLPDGRPVFKGPRLAMAVHYSYDYIVKTGTGAAAKRRTGIVGNSIGDDKEQSHTSLAIAMGDDEASVDYIGPAEELVRSICDAIHGGQVVLSEAGWAAVQDKLPGRPQVISLGRHLLSYTVTPSSDINNKWISSRVLNVNVTSGSAGPDTSTTISGNMSALPPLPVSPSKDAFDVVIMSAEQAVSRDQLLTEVMPLALAKRRFPPPITQALLDPGYHEAPDAGSNMAMVFVKIAKPKAVVDIEGGGGGANASTILAHMTDADILKIMTAHTVALSRAVAVARSLLPLYGGYECKEPEPGKLTLVFRSLKDGLAWSGAFQRDLVEKVDWPEEVLLWEDCKEAVEQEDTDNDDSQEEGEDDDCRGTEGEEEEGKAAKPSSSVVVWRGLRAHVGIAWGAPSVKAPLNTGRADYHGTVVNLAARLMSMAQPGQILVEGGQLQTVVKDLQWSDTYIDGVLIYMNDAEITTTTATATTTTDMQNRNDNFVIGDYGSGVMSSSGHGRNSSSSDEDDASNNSNSSNNDNNNSRPAHVHGRGGGIPCLTVHKYYQTLYQVLYFRKLGYAMIRGLEEPRLVVQVSPSSLVNRCFEEECPGLLLQHQNHNSSGGGAGQGGGNQQHHHHYYYNNNVYNLNGYSSGSMTSRLLSSISLPKRTRSTSSNVTTPRSGSIIKHNTTTMPGAAVVNSNNSNGVVQQKHSSRGNQRGNGGGGDDNNDDVPTVFQSISRSNSICGAGGSGGDSSSNLGRRSVSSAFFTTLGLARRTGSNSSSGQGTHTGTSGPRAMPLSLGLGLSTTSSSRFGRWHSAKTSARSSPRSGAAIVLGDTDDHLGSLNTTNKDHPAVEVKTKEDGGGEVEVVIADGGSNSQHHPGTAGQLKLDINDDDDSSKRRDQGGPETSLLSPGLAYARQVAQLFVDRRKWSKKGGQQ
jgi:class 3 adenylate cyclase